MCKDVIELFDKCNSEGDAFLTLLMRLLLELRWMSRTLS